MVVAIQDHTITDFIKDLFHNKTPDDLKTVWALLHPGIQYNTIYLLLRQGDNIELLKFLNTNISSFVFDDSSFLYQAIRSGDMATLKYCNEHFVGEKRTWIKSAIYKSLIQYENIEGGQKYLMDLLFSITKNNVW